MTKVDRLAERQFLEYESHLKHIDEVLQQARPHSEKDKDLQQHIAELEQHRGKMVDYIEDLRQKAPIEWMKEGGPMVLWDIMAERIEHLVERIQHHKNKKST